MSIRSRLTLVGNITVDDIHFIQEWPISGTSNGYSDRKIRIGGIGNMIEALSCELAPFVVANVGADQEGDFIRRYLASRHMNVDLRTHSDKPTSRAVICCQACPPERTSFVNWGCGAVPIKSGFPESDWSHVCYLDVALGLGIDELRKKSKTLSADLCLSSPSNEQREWVISCLPKLDYLFVSDSEFEPYKASTAATTVIRHRRESTIIYANGRESIVQNQDSIIEGISVLGAGDAYATGFILSSLRSFSSLEGMVKGAHEQARRFLMRET